MPKPKWTGWGATHDGYTDEAAAAKHHYHKRAQDTFKAMAEQLGLKRGEYDVRTNLAGPAVSGETTFHSEDRYVQIGGIAGLGILARTCNGRKDYTGGQNHWLAYHLMDDPARLAEAVRNLR